jgi:hypothetical protein
MSQSLKSQKDRWKKEVYERAVGKAKERQPSFATSSPDRAALHP